MSGGPGIWTPTGWRQVGGAQPLWELEGILGESPGCLQGKLEQGLTCEKGCVATRDREAGREAVS